MAASKVPGATEIGQAATGLPQIKTDVTKEIESVIAGQLAPLNAEAAQQTAMSGKAVTELGSLFDTITGSSQAISGVMRDEHAQAENSERAIIGEAKDHLTQIRAERAANAQKMAQLVGGPVDVGEWTSPVDLESSLFDASSAGTLLKASSLNEAALQHAEAFSGRVLPLMRAEAIKDTRARYDKELTRINAEIAAIKASKPGMINENVRKRQLEEREFALARATANRDWSIAKQSTKLEAQRLALQAAEVYGGEVTYDPKTGTYKPKPGGNPTLGGKQLNQAQKLAQKAAVADRKAHAIELVDAFMNPGVETIKGGKTWMPSSADAPGAFWNGNQWMVAVNAPDQHISHPPITNPNQLVQALAEKGIPRELAMKTVKLRFPDWSGVEGEAQGSPTQKNVHPKPPGAGGKVYTHAEMRKMSPAKVIKIARSLGFQQKVPPGIAILGRETTKNEKGIEVKNPKFSMADYNRKMKDFYMYWIMRINAEDAGSAAAGHPGK